MRIRFNLILGWLVLCGFACAQQVDVPSLKARRAGRETIAGLFGDDIRAAKTNLLKVSLSERLLETAVRTTNDPGAKYECLIASRKLAVEAGRLDLALEAITRCATAFRIDAVKEESKAVGDSCTKITDPALLDRITDVARRACEAEQFIYASKVIENGVLTSRRLDAKERFETFLNLRSEMKEQKKAWGLSERAARDLKKNPNDMIACRNRGRYLCLYKDDWSDGLTLLRRCGDQALMKIVDAESKPMATADAAQALGDLWWDWINRRPKERKDFLCAARYWYEKATNLGLSGIHKQRIEDRLVGLQQTRFLREAGIDKRVVVAGGPAVKLTRDEFVQFAASRSASLGGFAKQKWTTVPAGSKWPEGFVPQRAEFPQKQLMTDADLLAFRGQTAITDIHFRNARVTGDGVAALEGLPLQMLRLESNSTPGQRGRLSPQAIQFVLKSFPTLVDLAIDAASGMTLAQLEDVCSKTQWKALQLKELSVRVTSDHVKKLALCRPLRQLTLESSPIQGVDFSPLAALPDMRILMLSNTGLDSGSFQSCLKITQLSRLDARAARITDRDLKQLPQLNQLTELTLSNTPITDASVGTFSSMKQLKNLYLVQTRISRQGMQLLRRSLPNCKITDR